ncbi:MAG: hypothetical protein RDU89_07130 [bacterium]|nr:hypothetical protein [bacterium]
MITATTAAPGPRSNAFAVWFRDLERWSVGSFIALDWRWPRNMIRPLAEALVRKSSEVDRMTTSTDKLKLITLRFDGVIEPRQQHGNKPIKGRLWWADAGDVVYSRIDVRNGAIGIVPDDLGRVCVTSEYPVYEVDPNVADAGYIKLLFRTVTFRRKINAMISGASGRKRVQPPDLEAVEVPLPPLPVQLRIVASWEKAQAEVADTQQRIAEMEHRMEIEFLADLGLTKPQRVKLPRASAVQWRHLERWSVMFNQSGRVSVDLTAGWYAAVPLQECLEGTTNGYCIRPVNKETPHRMLKLNALQAWGLDVEQSKFVNVSEEIAKRFHLARGDLLICRSIGSFDHIAKCAVVEDDRTDILFPDIIIRARLNSRIEPSYAREVIQSSVGRAWFQQNARTAVGMWKIGGSDIAAFPMPLPPLPIQRELVSKVMTQRQRIAALKAEVEHRAKQAKTEVEERILGDEPVGA